MLHNTSISSALLLRTSAKILKYYCVWQLVRNDAHKLTTLYEYLTKSALLSEIIANLRYFT